jgi:CubicO group peptidase (beta-lactamase class C family)
MRQASWQLVAAIAVFSLSSLSGLSPIVAVTSSAGVRQGNEPPRRLESGLAGAAQTGSTREDTSSGLERRVLQVMKEGDVPGLSIAVVRKGTLVWHAGLGVKNTRTNEPLGPDTVFEAASLGKPVFAYAVLKLVDAGKLDLDKPLTHYLSGNYEVGADPRLAEITARRVLSHTSGLPNWRSGTLRIHFTPGDRFSYSGEGYVYLSKVVEQITSENIHAFMTRTVFDPLGMKNSSYAWRDSYDQLKTSYHNTRGEPTTRNRPGPENANVAATLHTTAQDYGRFVAAMLNGTGLRPATRDLMLSPVVSAREGGATTVDRPEAKPFPDVSWALGWGVQTTADGPSFFHWGNNGDAKAYVVARDKDKSGVVILANSVYGLSIVPDILEATLGGAQPGVAWLRIESYRAPARVFFRSLVATGAESTLREYRERRRARPSTESITEDQMNRCGLDLLRMGRVEDAIEVLKQNVADHPESFNVYDSLGEAYAVHGDRDLAIRNYERSIELNPRNQGGIDALATLRGKK